MSLLGAAEPAAHLAIGDAIDGLLALAAQPAEVRDVTITNLLDAAKAAAPAALS